MTAADLKPGDAAFWYSTLRGENVPVTIIKDRARRGRYLIRTETGYVLEAAKSMVSAEPVKL